MFCITVRQAPQVCLSGQIYYSIHGYSLWKIRLYCGKIHTYPMNKNFIHTNTDSKSKIWNQRMNWKQYHDGIKLGTFLNNVDAAKSRFFNSSNKALKTTIDGIDYSKCLLSRTIIYLPIEKYSVKKSSLCIQSIRSEIALARLLPSFTHTHNSIGRPIRAYSRGSMPSRADR